MQLAHHIGARVIGTVSTEEKAKLAREAGADEIIFYTQTDFEVETKRLTNGTGVDVVYDSVGKTTFEKGLNVLRPRGMMVLFGASSGAVAPVDPMILMKGSLFMTRPTLHHHIASRAELESRASSLFGMIAANKLKLRIEHILSPGTGSTGPSRFGRAQNNWEATAGSVAPFYFADFNAHQTVREQPVKSVLTLWFWRIRCLPERVLALVNTARVQVRPSRAPGPQEEVRLRQETGQSSTG